MNPWYWIAIAATAWAVAVVWIEWDARRPSRARAKKLAKIQAEMSGMFADRTTPYTWEQYLRKAPSRARVVSTKIIQEISLPLLPAEPVVIEKRVLKRHLDVKNPSDGAGRLGP